MLLADSTSADLLWAGAFVLGVVIIMLIIFLIDKFEEHP